MTKLRDYQVEAYEDVLRLWAEGYRSVLLHLATGLGKTTVMAAIHAEARKRRERVLVIAHLFELLENASNTFKDFNQHDVHYFEKGIDHFVPSSAINNGSVNMVFAMTQSLHKDRRLDKYPADYFQKIFIDETHRATAETYRKIINHFPGAQILGVTATPKRADKVGLKAVFDIDSKCSMSVTEGIGMGWLVPFRPTSYKVESLDYSGIKAKGDFTDEQIEEALARNGYKALHEIAAGLRDQAADLQTIVFLSGVESARELARIMRDEYNEPVDFVCGETDSTTRRNIIESYRKGETKRIVNVGVLTEGVDLPNTQCVAIGRITRSEGRYLQMAGRGTRPFPGGIVDLYASPQDRVNSIAASIKPECLLLDFKGNMGRIRPAIDGRDLLAGLMPHKSYNGMQKPDDATVIEIGKRPGNERLTIEELRQMAADELFVSMINRDDRFCGIAMVKRAEIKQYNDLFGLPFQPKENGKSKPKPPLPKHLVAYPEQRAKIISLHERLGKEPPATDVLLSTSRKKAQVVIGKLLTELGARNAVERR